MTQEAMLIQGQPAGSINEYNVYQALVRLKKTNITFQYPLDGGRGVRGGQVIDFVDWDPPQPTAIYVQGRRWHTGSFALEETLKQARVERLGWRVVEIWEEECMTVEAAVEAVRRKVL